MRYKRITQPTDAVVTVEEAAEQCRVVDPHDYPYLTGLIAKATRYLEGRLRRQLLTATWRLLADDFCDEIELRILPVQSIAAIQYLDTAGVLQTLAADQYQVDCESPNCPARIKPAPGLSWPSTQSDAYNAVRVDFVAGYGDAAADVPETTRHLVLWLASHWFEHREPINVGNIVNPIPLTFGDLVAAEGWGGYG